MDPIVTSDGLINFADGVWLGSSPVRIVGMPLKSTMTVLRLGERELLICSPVALTERLRAEVTALGRVAHLFAPNLFHHRWLGEWAAAFPEARVHAPAGLSEKCSGLRIDRIHGQGSEPAFAGFVEELAIEGFRLRETTLLYRPAQTLVVTDLVQNVGRPAHPWAAFYTRVMGFYDQVALSRVIRWTGFNDRAAARRSIEAILRQHFDALVVGHGAPLPAGGRAALEGAFRWLKA